MNELNKFTSKLNFKKIAIVFIVLAVLSGVISSFLFFHTFKEEFDFITQYYKIDEKMEDGKYRSIEEIEADLNLVSNKSDNLEDVILLDSQNNILYSAKNSSLAQSEKFTLKSIDSSNSSVLTLEESPNLLFKVFKDDDFDLENIFKFNKKQIKSKYNENKFYESIDNMNRTYFLTYKIDENLNVKVYFINKDIDRINFAPIIKGIGIIAISFDVAELYFVVYWILLALYVYEQARKANLNPALWGLITLCTNIIGLLVFLIYKQNIKTCAYCSYPQNSVYCVKCGKKIKRTCQKCGAVANPTDDFCNKCGESLNKENKENNVVAIEENETNKNN